MRYRPSKRIVWLAVPLIPVLLMCGLAFLAGSGGEPVDQATRGSKPPPAKSAVALDRKMAEWVTERFDDVMDWDPNPWKRREGLGYHFHRLKGSDRPEDVAEVARLRQLGKEWFERILTRYPELAIQKGKDVPKESNGTYQWNELLKRLRGEGRKTLMTEKFPDEFSRHLEKGKPLDGQAAREWLEKNRAILDELRAIGLLPGHSASDIPPDELVNDQIFWIRDAEKALMLEARLAAEDGDIARALESIRAAGGLLDHLGDNESPTLLSMMLTNNGWNQIRSSVFTSILPLFPPDQVDLAAWEDAVSPGVLPPADLARIMRGEWNHVMPMELLPVFADTADRNQPVDADHLVESYTQYIQGRVRQAEDPSSGPAPEVPIQHLSGRSRELATEFGLTGEYGTYHRWEEGQAQAGMTQAAFAILRGLPVPPDPMSGEPYVWNPEKRTLSLPPKYGKGNNHQIVVPRP